MTYESEEVREMFHLLPTADQINWLDIELLMNSRGYLVHVEDVIDPIVSISISLSVIGK